MKTKEELVKAFGPKTDYEYDLYRLGFTEGEKKMAEKKLKDLFEDKYERIRNEVEKKR